MNNIKYQIGQIEEHEGENNALFYNPQFLPVKLQYNESKEPLSL